MYFIMMNISVQVYLLDYGLVYRFNPDGNHKEYKEDPKRKHDGTIEFTSRDAHNGVGKVLINESFSSFKVQALLQILFLHIHCT